MSNTLYNRLADDESRIQFAGYAMSRLSGSYGYLSLSRYEEYSHPACSVGLSDIVIDCGLFSAGNVNRFLKANLPDGKVYGFEANPFCWECIESGVGKDHSDGRFVLVKQGVWHEKSELHFKQMGSASRVVAKPDRDSIAVPVVAIDDYCEQYAVTKVDVIKLDVEGAELSALKGAARIIRRDHPKLMVSAYHKRDDIIELPAYVDSLGIGYDLRFASHAINSTAHMFYFTPR